MRQLAAQRQQERQEIMKAQASAKKVGSQVAACSAGESAAERAHQQSVQALSGVRAGCGISQANMRSDSSGMIKEVQQKLKQAVTSSRALPSYGDLAAQAQAHGSQEVSGTAAATAAHEDASTSSSTGRHRMLHELLPVDPKLDPLYGLQFDSFEQLQAHAATVGQGDISSASALQAALQKHPTAGNILLQEEPFEEILPHGQLSGRMHATEGCAPDAPAMLDNFTACSAEDVPAAAGHDSDSDSDSDSDTAGASSGYVPWEGQSARPPAVPGTHSWVLPPAQPPATAMDHTHQEQDDEEEIEVLDSAALGASTHDAVQPE